MKMIKLAMALMVVFALVLPGQVFGQEDQYGPPQEGDTCECGFVFAGTEADEDHRHCPTCKAQYDNDEDMGQHCADNEGHCPDDGGEGDHPTGGGDHPTGGGDHPTGEQEGTCPECGHVYSGEEDHHGHCRECEAVMNDQSDWDTHCQANPEHCRPQEGDECHECDYVFTGDEGEAHGHCHKCDHVYNSEEDHHGHCDYEGCDAVMNSDAEWDEHCRDNEGHCPGGGGGDDGPARFDDVNTSDDDCINLDEAYAFFGQGEDRDEFANGNDEEPGFNDIASRKENDECGNDQASRKEFYMATYEWMNGMNEEEDMGMGQATMANCSAWCAGIPEYKTKDENGEWSSAMARYADEDCPCHEGNH